MNTVQAAVRGARRFLASVSLVPAGIVFASVSAFATPAKAPDSFGQVPLAFEQNAGQTDPRFQFVARGAGHAIYLAADEAVVALEQGNQPSSRDASPEYRSIAGHSPGSLSSQRFLKFTWIGSRADAPGRGTGTLPGKVHHLTGRPDEWVMNQPVFAQVRFADVYPGIDLVYHGNQALFEYDFVVAPGVDPASVRFRVEGADHVAIDSRGDLVLAAGDGSFRQHRPVVYQTINGDRRNVEGRFVLKKSSAAEGVEVSFGLGPFDRRYPLVIDPILSLGYSTYLGGGKADQAWAVGADAAGQVYVAGDTLGILKNVPAVGFQTNSGGGTKYGGDAFVAKLDATGTNFVYFTYLGGNSLESANGLAVDASGAVYVTGFTTSTNFPVFPINVFQPQINSFEVEGFGIPHADAFVTKLDAAGLLVYSTYLGGEFADVGASIAVDTGGNAYITGYTDSVSSYLVTNQVATMTCTNFSLTNLICGPDVLTTNLVTGPRLIDVEVVTNVVATKVLKTEPPTTNQTVTIATSTLLGWTNFTAGFPILNAVQTNNSAAAPRVAPKSKGKTKTFEVATRADVFVTKLGADGTALIYSTYLGGSLSADYGTGIAVDPAGNAIGSAVANDVDFPVTNAVQSFFSGGRDGVAFKLDPTGTALVYSTYLGGLLTDIAYGVATDAAGSAYVVGSVASKDFLSTAGQVRPGGVAKSVDGAANWSQSSSGLTHTGVRDMVINPAAPSTLYAATPRGVFRSVDAAGTWTPSSADLDGQDITAVSLNPLSPATVYAAGSVAFYRSDDSGFDWTPLGNGLPVASTSSILSDPVAPEILYTGTRTGFYVSTNSGTNFARIGSGLKNRPIHRLAIHPVVPAILYAATDDGVFQTTNAGLNWRAMNVGLATRKVLGLAINPSTPAILLAGTVKGVYRTTDSATNWVGVTNGMGRPQVNTLIFDPGDSSVVYAGATNGLFKSIDGGVNWFTASNGLPAQDLVALAIDPSNPAVVYAGARGTNFSGGTNDAFLIKLSPDGLTLDYGFTFGGNKSDEARGVAVDTNSSAFVTGLTLSKNFPVNSATGYWQSTNSGKADAFVAQFDPTGTSNVFSIFLGGGRTDNGHAIALDGLGGIYVVGRTDSKNFVVTNAVQGARSGEKHDAFITKLSLPEPESTEATPQGGVPAMAFPPHPLRRR